MTTINVGDLLPYVVFINTATTLWLAISTYMRKPGTDAGAAVAELKRAVDDRHRELELEQTRIREQMRHMPTREQLGELETTMGSLAAQIKAQTDAQSERFTKLERQLETIRDFLMRAK